MHSSHCLKALYITHLSSDLFIHILACILQEKEKDKNKERERDAKDKERRTSNGHLFTAIMTVPTIPCHQCNKPINTREAFLCTNCNAQVHKGCRESLPVCAKVKMKVIHCLLYWFSYDCHKRIL
uniref:Phorbol-ester/DAG-type domain-containing protein n=1 Tax=Cyprinus carpio TaxID=7962 RepID=A0A8C2BI05_CYPCA